MPVNKPLELMNFAGTPLACASVAPVSPSPLLLRRRGFGQSSQLSAALTRLKK
jgi:hypothetical protein